MKRTAWAAIILLVALLSAGALGAAPADTVRTYSGRGVLRNYDAASAQATISHEAIPGYMGAMTMAYRASEAKDFADIAPGDALTFRLCVTSDDAWIDQVRKVGTAAFLVPAPPSPERELRPGDAVPDLAMENQRGEDIRLSDFRGRVVVFTFIYSRCPLPTYCPLTTKHFQEAQEVLSRLGVAEGWHFLSITLDPANDTPQELAVFAESRHVDARRWTFARADASSVARFGRAFGLEFSPGPDGAINHNLRTVVVDPSGHLARIFRGNTWTPQELAAEVRSALAHRP